MTVTFGIDLLGLTANDLIEAWGSLRLERSRRPGARLVAMDLLVEFFRHNTMMNQRLLEACQKLPPGQLAATVRGTYGTLGATLVHIVNAQEGYVARFFGKERPERLAEEPFPGFAPLSERLARSDMQLEKAAAEASKQREVQVTGSDPPGTFRMAGSLILLQAVNHGTEHRSQIATILTQLGVEPPEMDGWTYFFESGKLVPV